MLLKTNTNRVSEGMAMNKKLSREQMFFNEVSLTRDDDVYVGIDVHKKSYCVVIWLNDAPAVDFVRIRHLFAGPQRSEQGYYGIAVRGRRAMRTLLLLA